MLDVSRLLVQSVQTLCCGYPDALLVVFGYTLHLIVGKHIGVTPIATIRTYTIVVVAVKSIARGHPKQTIAVVNEVGDFLEGKFIELLYDAVGGERC